MISYIEGLMLGATLIIAIGAQNAFVIRQGVKGEHVFAVAGVCAVVDIILIALGAAGVGSLVAQNEMLRIGAAWGGALFLTGFGLLSVRAAYRASPGAWAEADYKARISSSGRGKGARAAMAAAAGFSLLNPHVYLDTVVLLGGNAAQYDGAERVKFTFGAMTASLIWFFGIGYGAIKMSPFFRSAKGARVLEGGIAIIMFTIPFSLVHTELQR